MDEKIRNVNTDMKFTLKKKKSGGYALKKNPILKSRIIECSRLHREEETRLPDSKTVQ